MAYLGNRKIMLTCVGSSGSGGDKFKKLVSGNLSTITANDLNGVTNIRESAFESLEGLTQAEIPASVTTIGERAFSRCVDLRTITINAQLTEIPAECFYMCILLNNIILPSSIQVVGHWAFSGCIYLSTMTILASTPPTLMSSDSISSATTTIYVPAGSKTAYESATNWASLTTRATNPVTFVELE